MSGREPGGSSPAGLARRRARCYGLLSRALSPPTPGLVGALGRAGAVRGLCAVAGAGAGLPPPPAAGRLEACLARWRRCDPARVIRRLGQEYRRLFVGPYHVEAPPYESCYRSPERAVMGAPAVAVVTAYREAGLVPDPRLRDLPDHVAIELAFLATLCGKEAALRRGGRRAPLAACLDRQARFLAEHPATWIRAFAGQVAGAARDPFYPALAALAADHVTADRTLVGALREAAW